MIGDCVLALYTVVTSIESIFLQHELHSTRQRVCPLGISSGHSIIGR